MGCKNSCQTYNVTKEETMPSKDDQILAVTQDLKNLSTEEKERSDNEVKKVCKEKNNIEVGKEDEKPCERRDGADNVEDDEEKENTSTCNFCNKEGPAKRCSKRHPKCIKKLFCNTTCEELAHKKKSTTGAAKKTEVKKKKKYTYKDPCQWAL